MKRRAFLGAIAGAATLWPRSACSQQAGKIHRIGFLSPGSAGGGNYALRHEAFVQGLRDLGYEAGRNIEIEYRFADEHFEWLPALAAELAALKVDVIVALVTQAALAARNATNTIPIVMVAVSDPLASGLVPTLRKPGGNITGTGSMTAETVGKTLQLLKEVVPNLSQLAVMWNPNNQIFQAQMLAAAQAAAAVLGVQPQPFRVRNADEIESTFAAISQENLQALLVLNDPLFIQHTKQIVDLAQRHRLPAVYGQREFALAGGLMAYGTDFRILFRRTASYVHKILSGEKPADLPVELPTKFELTLNLKVAKSLGLAFPLPLLGRADEVIE